MVEEIRKPVMPALGLTTESFLPDSSMNTHPHLTYNKEIILCFSFVFTVYFLEIILLKFLERETLTEPTIYVCALTWNRTLPLFGVQDMLQPTEPH